ncbi:MAG: hypothetical protein ACTTKM_08285 [Prevotella fusca]
METAASRPIYKRTIRQRSAIGQLAAAGMLYVQNTIRIKNTT